MSRTAVLAAAVLVALVTAFGGHGTHAAANVPAPYTETDQLAYFYGLAPNSQYVVRLSASHYDGDAFPYTLGTNAYSNAVGTAKANVAMDSLSAFYGPVYEVTACIYAESDVNGLHPLKCTAPTYVGYYPEAP
jgi:hypothetical protein